MSAAGPSPTFVPSRLLANCHVQTAFGTTLRRAFLRPHLQRQRIELADGDFDALTSPGRILRAPAIDHGRWCSTGSRAVHARRMSGA